ncbi:SRPBCC family protein [Candidatus Woesearchaeota archaeon]|nr:SRPBCC family protein [Candidatus Woesearchaeota archaeon]
MGSVSQKITLNGKLEDIWKFITKPENFPKYVYGYADGKTTSPNSTGIGASYEWYGKLGPFKLKSTEKIIRWQEQKYVAYTGKLFGVAFNSSMDVKEIKQEQTILTVSIKYKVPIYLGGEFMDFLLIKWIVKDYIRKSLYGLNEIFNE